MSVIRIKIENYKSIRKCDIAITNINLLIGENGTGKTNILEAINYFYSNMLDNNIKTDVFDVNNNFSNEVKIAVTFDMNSFYKIAKYHIKQYLLNDKVSINHYGYYKKIMRICLDGARKNISLVMRQFKNNRIIWNYNYKDRSFLQSLFPFFYINTRNIDIVEWKEIWDIIGHLAKISNDEQLELHNELQDTLMNEDHKISDNINTIERILEDANIKIKKSTAREFAKSLAQTYLGGYSFNNNGYNLSFFSDGTNSVNYIKLLLRTVYYISKKKLKRPFILIDEPEISLHHLYIDELAEHLTKDMKEIHTIIATHSPRLTKNIIQSESLTNVYNLKLINKYTFTTKMKLFTETDGRARYFVTDEHANAYFSRAMILVEGETELELFTNYYIRELFPFLKHIDLYKALSNDVLRDIVHPNQIKTRIPFLLIIDMDKAIKYQRANNKFELGDYLKKSRLNTKENFLFNKKKNFTRYNTYLARKRICAMTEKCRFHIFTPMYSCKDPNFKQYVNAIKNYLLNYNTYACKTTIEGLLITEESSDYILAFMKNKKPTGTFNHFETLYNGLQKTDRLNALRLAYRGKTDLLQKLKNTNIEEIKKTTISKVSSDKTDGWITDFLGFYFKTVLSSYSVIINSKKDFVKALKDTQLKSKLAKEFLNTFPELGEVIYLSKKMISNIL